jgi:hypothetical protein
MTIAARLHRTGWARLINCSSNSMNALGTAYVETRGPAWLGRRLAIYVVRKSALCRAEWESITITRTETIGGLITARRRRWHLRYMRVSR